MKKTNRILIISGPTSSGKSALAKIISTHTNSIIINADSMQLYKELPILSSQPTLEDVKNTEHFLYSIFNYDQDSSVAIWLDLVKKILDENKNSNKLPIIVGGTGLYISRLLEGINFIPAIDLEVKIKSRKLYDEIGREEFIKILIDQNEDSKIKKLDKQRLIRRHEILIGTAKSLDHWQSLPNQNIFADENFIHVNLELEREELYKNCNLRFEEMLKNGAIEEVKELMKSSPSHDLPITKTIGYFEIVDYLKNLISKKELIDKATQKTRNYAKRQSTWFRGQFKNKIIITDPKNSAEKIMNLLKS